MPRFVSLKLAVDAEVDELELLLQQTRAHVGHVAQLHSRQRLQVLPVPTAQQATGEKGGRGCLSRTRMRFLVPVCVFLFVYRGVKQGPSQHHAVR